MRREEAEKLVGSKVSVWTGLNGEYYGTLLRVFGKPWRGEVRVEAVLDPASGSGARMPYADGQVFDAGGSSIKPWAGPHPGTWRDTAIACYQAMADRFQAHHAHLLKVEAGQASGYGDIGIGADLHRTATAIVARLKAGEDGKRWGPTAPCKIEDAYKAKDGLTKYCKVHATHVADDAPTCQHYTPPARELCPDGCCECALPGSAHDEQGTPHPNGCCQHGFKGRIGAWVAP